MENAYCVSSFQTHGSFQKSGWEECKSQRQWTTARNLSFGYNRAAENMNAEQLLQQHSQDLWDLKPEQIPVWELSMQSHS